MVGLATNLSPASVTGPCPWHMPPASGRRCLCSSSSLLDNVIVIIIIFVVVISITRPKPAYSRQGLAGSWGQDTDEVSTFLVFLTSHFAPAALSFKLTWDH